MNVFFEVLHIQYRGPSYIKIKGWWWVNGVKKAYKPFWSLSHDKLKLSNSALPLWRRFTPNFEMEF